MQQRSQDGSLISFHQSNLVLLPKCCGSALLRYWSFIKVLCSILMVENVALQKLHFSKKYYLTFLLSFLPSFIFTCASLTFLSYHCFFLNYIPSVLPSFLPLFLPFLLLSFLPFFLLTFLICCSPLIRFTVHA